MSVCLNSSRGARPALEPKWRISSYPSSDQTIELFVRDVSYICSVCAVNTGILRVVFVVHLCSHEDTQIDKMFPHFSDWPIFQSKVLIG